MRCTGATRAYEQAYEEKHAYKLLQNVSGNLRDSRKGLTSAYICTLTRLTSTGVFAGDVILRKGTVSIIELLHRSFVENSYVRCGLQLAKQPVVKNSDMTGMAWAEDTSCRTRVRAEMNA